MVNKIIMDLDGTLTVGTTGTAYLEQRPRKDVVEGLRRYKAKGYEIVIFTARNMRTYDGCVGKINVHTLPIILDWLNKHEVPFDEVIVGKPWCGHEGFYVDDRAIRPDEFVSLNDEEIKAIIDNEVA